MRGLFYFPLQHWLGVLCNEDTFVMMFPWGWHLDAETCSSWHMSRKVCHGIHLLNDILIVLRCLFCAPYHPSSDVTSSRRVCAFEHCLKQCGMPAVFSNRNWILAGTFNTFSMLLFWFRFCYFWVTSNHWKIRHGQSNKGLWEIVGAGEGGGWEGVRV